jgi:MATE family multidrug resistance protein
MAIAGVGYWVIGLGSAWLFGFWLGWGAAGLWWGLALGLAFTAALLAWRFELLSRRQFST